MYKNFVGTEETVGIGEVSVWRGSTVHNFNLVPKCCLFQKFFSALTGSVIIILIDATVD